MALSCFKYLIKSGFLQQGFTRDSFIHLRHSSSVKTSISNNKMFTPFILNVMIFVYFWYFYGFHSSQSVPKPKTSAPDVPEPLNLEFHTSAHTTFRFLARAVVAWEHTLKGGYLVSPDKIAERDDCYPYTTPVKIPAKGLSLYTYLQENPHIQNTIQEESPYLAHHSENGFYFTCENRHIVTLNMCPSGSFFQNQICVKFTSCTGKPDFFKLPLPNDIHGYIECKNNREFPKQCPKGTYFYHDRCVDQSELTHYCKLHDTVVPFKIDDVTLFECIHRKPHYITCEPGTKMFDTTVCEPTLCVGKPDYTKIALPKAIWEPFYFSPGYTECLQGRVSRTVECPSTWDTALTKGDNLTALPMVFDGLQCAVPTFCENVFSHDPDVIVPVHAFTKDVRNWALSKHYDASAGFKCTPAGRKRKSLNPGQRVGKKFRIESACDTPSSLLPIDKAPRHYYDCARQHTVSCKPDEFFDGGGCALEPPNAFKYQDVPLFKYDMVDEWIKPWDYDYNASNVVCQSADYTHSTLYNVCIHKDCANYAFLAMVPSMAILLPRHDQAQCTYDEGDRHIKKDSVPFNYTFWDQQPLLPDITRTDTCTFGQKIKSGNFIWDSTVFATCDTAQPFIFCPVSTELVRENKVYACDPPSTTTLRHTTPHTWTSYTTNEFKRILPTTNTVTRFYINRGDKRHHGLDPNGAFEIPLDTRIFLNTTEPVDLEFRYKVTHPPNVVFLYDDTNTRVMTSVNSGQGFLVRLKNFTKSKLNFPTYTPHILVNAFNL